MLLHYIARGASEGRLAGKHLVGDDTEAIDIRARVQRFPGALLGRHVKRCAHDRANASENSALRRTGSHSGLLVRQGLLRGIAEHKCAIAVVRRLSRLLKHGCRLAVHIFRRRFIHLSLVEGSF